MIGVFAGAAYTPPALADSFKQYVKGVKDIVEGESVHIHMKLIFTNWLQGMARPRWYFCRC